MENQDPNYKRVSCNFYDQLEAHATLNEQVKIVYFQDEVRMEEAIHIQTLETRNKAEYLITKSGKRIRLDWIISAAKA